MLLLLADQMIEKLLDVPKTTDVSAYFGWVVTVLVIVLTLALTGLYRLFSVEKQETKEANERNSALLQRELDYARSIQGQQHEKIVEKLGVIALNSDTNHKIVTEKLNEIRSDLRSRLAAGQ